MLRQQLAVFMRAGAEHSVVPDCLGSDRVLAPPRRPIWREIRLLACAVLWRGLVPTTSQVSRVGPHHASMYGRFFPVRGVVRTDSRMPPIQVRVSAGSMISSVAKACA